MKFEKDGNWRVMGYSIEKDSKPQDPKPASGTAKAVRAGAFDKALQIQDSTDAAEEFLTLLVQVGLAKAGGMENSNPSMIEMENKVARYKEVIDERMLLTPDITIAKVASKRLADCKKKQIEFNNSGGALDTRRPEMRQLQAEMDVLSEIIAKGATEPPSANISVFPDGTMALDGNRHKWARGN